MAATTFEKVKNTNDRLYGPRKLLLCGFQPQAQNNFKKLLNMLGMEQIPMVWVTTSQFNDSIANLLESGDGTGEGEASDMPRAVIVSGISQRELHLLLNGCRQAGMKQALWAVLTPTSETWTINHLISELHNEREAMSKRT